MTPQPLTPIQHPTPAMNTERGEINMTGLRGDNEPGMPRDCSVGIDRTGEIALLGEESPRCEILLSDLISHFSCKIPTPPASPGPDFLPQVQESSQPDNLTFSISLDEVTHQLGRLPLESAAGPDGITYEMWKWNPEAHHLLVKFLNICIRNKRIPRQWQTSSTIPIYKKGDKTTPSNWRPILQPNTYLPTVLIWSGQSRYYYVNPTSR